VRYLKDAVPEIDDSEGVPPHEEVGGPPQCPILVFINPSSGGKCGPLLQKLLRQGLGEQQVCTLDTSRSESRSGSERWNGTAASVAPSCLQVLDISDPKQHPDKVLSALYSKLDAAAAKGDEVAKQIKKWVGC
jgi:hypothetical protein